MKKIVLICFCLAGWTAQSNSMIPAAHFVDQMAAHNQSSGPETLQFENIEFQGPDTISTRCNHSGQRLRPVLSADVISNLRNLFFIGIYISDDESIMDVTDVNENDQGQFVYSIHFLAPGGLCNLLQNETLTPSTPKDLITSILAAHLKNFKHD